VSFGRQLPSDLDIIKVGPRQREHLLLHLAVSRQGSHGVDRQQDLQLGGLATAPYDPHLRAVSSGTAQDHLVYQTAQQRLAMLAADRGIGPQFGEALAEGDDLGPQAGIEPIGLGLDLACTPREGLFGATKRAERRLPAPLEFGRDEPIVGTIDHLPEHGGKVVRNRPTQAGRQASPDVVGVDRHSPSRSAVTRSRSSSASKRSFVGTLRVEGGCRLVAEIGRSKNMSGRYTTRANCAERTPLVTVSSRNRRPQSGCPGSVTSISSAPERSPSAIGVSLWIVTRRD